MSGKAKPNASLSLDLDNQWSYMKTHGDAGWEEFPSYLDVVVPRANALFAKHGLTITYFIVGQDAALEKNHTALREITEAGHEVGNHSFHHEPWLHLYTDEEIRAELAAAEEAIVAATGQHPRGFRGPGFSFSPALLETLKRRGYYYDASTFPTFLGPLARLFYFFSARLTREERTQRKALFGSFAEGFRPLRPYLWELEAGPLLEVPVTTLPIVRVPFHLSYLIYLAEYSQTLARLYFRVALILCRLCRVEPSVLLHPLDFLGTEDVGCLAFFPGMRMKAAAKLAFVDWALGACTEAFNVLPMGQHIEAILAAGVYRRVRPGRPSSTEVGRQRSARGEMAAR